MVNRPLICVIKIDTFDALIGLTSAEGNVDYSDLYFRTRKINHII